MHIERLTLRNIRSYRSADIHLTPGTTLLSGDIGAGKTSLLYGIELALFGFSEVEPEHLVRHRAREAEVTLTLTDGKRRWELRRRIVRKSRKGRDAFDATESSLAIDGQRADYSATELRRWAIELLGFPDNPNPRAHSDVWRWAVYLAQERMREVLDPDVEARMDTVRKALGVEQYRLAAENARAVSRALREQSDSLAEQADRHRGIEEEVATWSRLQQDASKQVAQLLDREQSLRSELEHARRSLELADAERRKVEADRQALGHVTDLLRELAKDLGADRAALAGSRDRLLRLETELEREREPPSPPAPNIAGLRKQRAALETQRAELERLRGQAQAVEGQLLQWNTRNSTIQAQLDATQLELDGARQARRTLEAVEPVQEPRCEESRSTSELTAERRELEEARRSLDRRLAAAVSELSELESLVAGGVCPRCHRPVETSEFGPHQHEQETCVRELREELERATDRVNVLERAMETRAAFERLRDRWAELELRRREARERERALQERQEGERALRDEQHVEHDLLSTTRRELTARLGADDLTRAELERIDHEIELAEARDRAEASRRERVKAIEGQLPAARSDVLAQERLVNDREVRRCDLSDRIAAETTRLAALGRPEEPWAAAQLGVERLQGLVEAAVRESSRPQAQAAEAAARLDELGRRRHERELLVRRGSELRSLAAWVDGDFRSAMLDLERRRLQQGRSRFEALFSRYFAALVDDPALAARVDEAFAPWVDVAGEATPAEALSGGERTALALAYRLALGRTVREAGHLRLDTLILDEPTEGFSQEQTLRMGDLLETLGLPQVLLVSHEAQLEGVADRVLEVRKQDGLSRIEEGGRPVAPPAPATEPPETGVPVSPVRAAKRKIRRLTDLESPGDAPSQAR